MSFKKIVTNGFVRDENGKWDIVPLKIPGGGSVKKPSERKRERKYIPIERLPPDVYLQSSPQHEPKRRKLEDPVRKELFKDSRRSRIASRPSIKTYQSKNLKFTNTSKSSEMSSGNKLGTSSKPHILPLSDGSPLLDIDEAEELLIKLPLKSSTMTPIIIQNVEPVNGDIPKKNVNNEQNGKTPSSNESIDEFIEIEKNLTTVEVGNNKIESPMSAVCNLLQNAKIKNSSGKHNRQCGPILSEIINLFEKSKSEFCILQQQITAYTDLQKENFNKIADLLKQLENNDCDKENKSRRSNRIAGQVTITKEKMKFVVSPAVSKKVDLRKSTLNKNLTKTLQTDIKSPKMRRAVDMYNTFRSEYNSVLCTPKLDRSAMDMQQSSVTRSLSRRIQKQCLLLQDTPKPTEK